MTEHSPLNMDLITAYGQKDHVKFHRNTAQLRGLPKLGGWKGIRKVPTPERLGYGNPYAKRFNIPTTSDSFVLKVYDRLTCMVEGKKEDKARVKIRLGRQVVPRDLDAG